MLIGPNYCIFIAICRVLNLEVIGVYIDLLSGQSVYNQFAVYFALAISVGSFEPYFFLWYVVLVDIVSLAKLAVANKILFHVLVLR